MSNIDELNKNQNTDKSEKAAAILAALLKSKSSSNNNKSNHTENSNLWLEQMYE